MVLRMVVGAQLLAGAVPLTVLVVHTVVVMVVVCAAKVVMLSEKDVETLSVVRVANRVAVGVVMHCAIAATRASLRC